MTRATHRELIVGLSPGSRPDGRLAAAVGRGGGYAALDLGTDPARATAELAVAASRYDGPFAVRVSDPASLERIELPPAVDTVLVAVPPGQVIATIGAVHAAGRRVWVEVTSAAEATDALSVEVDGLVAKGSESGGRVGSETAFVLAQRIIAMSPVPVWVQGGIGLHTAAAAVAGGAAGVVLDASWRSPANRG